MREILRKLQKNHRKGYTLAELLIVIVITGILASFGFVEVAKSQRKLKRTEMDNTAREIFVAAQNHLTASQTSGAWEAAYFINGEVNLKSIEDYQGAIGYSLMDDYPTTDNVSDKSHAYYYVIYNQTPKYENALTDQNSALTKMLPYGSVDDTIRKYGSYIIEFDAKTESIYGVFYTDKGTITKDDLDNLTNVRTDATARETFKLTSDGKTYQVGYYGGATAKKNEVNYLVNPTVTIYNDGRTGYDASGNAIYPTTATDPYYEDVNKNALVAVIKDPNYTTVKPTELTVTVTQVSNGTSTAANTASFTISAPSQQVNDTSNGSLTIGAYSNVDKKALQNLVSKGLLFTKKLDSSEKGIVYYISLDDIAGDLDSLTICKTHFADLFTTITPGSDISVKAILKYGSEAPAEDAKTANSLFDSINNISTKYEVQDTATGNYQANILTGRHLANLSKDISGYDGAANFKILSAKLLGSIDWKKYINNKKTPTNVTYVNARSVVDNLAFPTIFNSTLMYFNGNNQELSNFDTASHQGTVDAKQTAGVGGLFSQVGNQSTSLTIADLNLNNIDVSSTLEAGTLIGRADKTMTITNVHAYNSSADTYGVSTNTDKTKYGVQSGTYSAGGLVGVTVSDITITNSSASVCVLANSLKTGTGNIGAGGLIGNINSGKATITDCYSGGKVYDTTIYAANNDLAANANVTGDNAGGFIGLTNSTSVATITRCYTTASVYGSTYAGGFIGNEMKNTSSIISLNDVYSAGDIDGSTVGLFIGNLTKSNALSISGYCDALDGISDATNTVGNKNNNSKITVVSAATLSSLRSTSTTGTAEPYDTDLGTSYPYPTTVSKVHYGDWLYPTGNQQVTLTKNIVLPAGTYPEDQKETIKNLILSNTSIIFKDTTANTSTTYPFNMTGINVAETSNGWTLSIPASVKIGDKYTITEHTTTAVINSFNSYTVAYSYSLKNKQGKVIAGQSGTSSGSDSDVTIDSTSGIKLNAKQSLEVVFTNTYLKTGPGFVYYEKYEGGGSYMHGYNVSDQIGSQNGFPTAKGVKVVEDGYLLIVPNANYDKLSAAAEDDNSTAEKSLKVKVNGSEWSLNWLIKKGTVDELTESEMQALGISQSHAYRIDFDYDWKSANSMWSVWSKYGYSTVSFSDSYEMNEYGDYCMNPYYADSVSPATVSNYNYNPTNTLRPIIRSASQLYRINQHDTSIRSWGVPVLYNNGSYWQGLGVQQVMDIDMSSYSLTTFAGLWGTSYAGVAFPGTESSPVYPTLSGLKVTMFDYIHSDASVSNLNVVINTNSITVANSTSYNLGTFINKNMGKISNVNFNDNTLSNCWVDDGYRLTSFGVIAYSSGATLENISFNNTTWTSVTVNATYAGLLGRIDGGSTVKGISVNGTTYDRITLRNPYYENNHPNDFGLIGYVNGTVSDISMSNNTVTSSSGWVDYFGNIAYADCDLSSVKMDNTNWTGNSTFTASQSAGMIAFARGSVNDLTITNTNINNIIFNTTYFGLTGYIGGDLTNVTMTGTRIGSDNQWQYYTTINATYVGLVSDLLYGKTLSNATISDTKFEDLNGDITYGGIIGSFDGKLDGVHLSDIYMYNSAGSTAAIKGESFGLIANISGNGSAADLTVQKGTTAYGLKMENLILNTRYWGVIAHNEGTVSGTTEKPITFNDIFITGINSSAEPSTIQDAVTRSYGVVGYNGGILTNFVMNDIRLGGATDVEKIQLPTNEKNQFIRVHFGVIGYNEGNSKNELGNGNVADVKIENIYKSDTAVQTKEYGFIGVNYGRSVVANVHDITITNYSSKGNGIVWMNMFQQGVSNRSYISNIIVKNTPEYQIVGNAFALENDDTMSNCVITDTSNKTTSIPGTGTATDCKLNGNTVPAGS